MGHIKEQEGVDFVVDSTPLTTEDRKKISEIIAYYKATGKIIKHHAQQRSSLSRAEVRVGR